MNFREAVTSSVGVVCAVKRLGKRRKDRRKVEEGKYRKLIIKKRETYECLL